MVTRPPGSMAKRDALWRHWRQDTHDGGHGPGGSHQETACGYTMGEPFDQPQLELGPERSEAEYPSVPVCNVLGMLQGAEMKLLISPAVGGLFLGLSLLTGVAVDLVQAAGGTDALHAVSQALESVDVVLESRLGSGVHQRILTACEAQTKVLVTCGAGEATPARCREARDELAACAVKVPSVATTYAKLEADRRAAFTSGLYVHNRGLLAQMSLDVVGTVTAACQLEGLYPLLACLKEQPDVVKAVAVLDAEAKALFAVANQALKAAGAKTLNADDLEGLVARRLPMRLKTPPYLMTILERTCRQKPDLKTLTEASDVSARLTCLEELVDTHAAANPVYVSPEQLRAALQIARAKIVPKIREKDVANQGKAFDAAMLMMLALAVGGFFVVLLMPLLFRRNSDLSPDVSRGNALRAGALAAATFLATMVALTSMLLVVKWVQGSLIVDSTSPKLRIVDAAFDVLERDDFLQAFSELSRERLDFIQAPLDAVAAEATETLSEDQLAFTAYLAEHWASMLEVPELRLVARNVDLLHDNVQTYRDIFGLYKASTFLMALIPVLLGMLAALLYLLPMRQTLLDIARGARQQAGKADESPLSMLLGELKLLGPYLLIILIALPAVGAFLALALTPLIEIFVNYALLAVFYMLFAKASVIALYLSLGAAIVLLLFVLLHYILATIFIVGTARKVLYARFHEGHTSGQHRDFFTRGSVAALWTLACPALLAWAAVWLGQQYVAPGVDIMGPTDNDMMLLPVIAMVVFPLLMWLTRCFKSLGYIKNYEVAGPTPLVAKAEV